jgi:hypothetical protein
MWSSYSGVHTPSPLPKAPTSGEGGGWGRMMREVLLRFIRNKVERVIYSLDSRCFMHLLLVQTCGNDEKRQPRNVVILGLDPGIQGVFNLPAKDTDLFLEIVRKT